MLIRQLIDLKYGYKFLIAYYVIYENLGTWNLFIIHYFFY